VQPVTRDCHKTGCSAIDVDTNKPKMPTHVIRAAAAGVAATATEEWFNGDPVPYRNPGHALAVHHRPAELVTEDHRRRDATEPTVPEEQVRATDTDVSDLNEDLPILGGGLGNITQLKVSGSCIHDGVHGASEIVAVKTALR
jgi:hypothetical protein